MPRSTMRPAVGVSRRRIRRPTVDLPQPDSPTRHSVSPGAMLSVTPSTALTTATVRRSTPLSTGKCMVRSVTSATGVLMPRDTLADVPAGRDVATAVLGKRRRLGRGTGRWRGRSAARTAQPGIGARRSGTMPAISCNRLRVGRAGAMAGDAGQQAARVGMQRAVEQVEHRRFLHLAPGIHHDDALAGFRHHAEVVGDHQDGGAEALLEFQHQLEDLRLDGDVERGGGLVGDQQLRIAGQRHGDHHPLAHAAGELVRIVAHPARGVGDAHQGQHLRGAGPGLGVRLALVDDDRLGDLLAHGQHRVERGHRFLEHHGDAVAADAPHRRLVERQQVEAVEAHGAADHAAEHRRQQAHDGKRGDRLAAARFADHARASRRRRPRRTSRPRRG